MQANRLCAVTHVMDTTQLECSRGKEVNARAL